MTTKNPFSYVPRRRKIVPIGIGMYVTPPTPIVIHPSSPNTASRKMQATPIPIGSVSDLHTLYFSKSLTSEPKQDKFLKTSSGKL